MSLLKSLLAATAVAFALPAFAEGITVHDPYARVSTAMSKSGAAFMQIENTGAVDDRLIAASSDIADRVELHTHKADDKGVMQMLHVPEGFVIPAGGNHALQRGGDHVMFLGLRQGLSHGDVVTVTLTFEQAGELVVDIPVDLQRDGAAMGQQMQHMHGAPAGMPPKHMHAPSN
ncbi:copper chaperone PCu(A)C [Phaeovulum sp. NW3]|uniref:copper chaperone PCu(A)C n=1 Tax=Phaeovulum sp. NW3 TaxID=2934933 RepID=UPI002020895C|nr:copper chaperone PCu(A)C [Phaeovulum sp. NW3]MCL7463649.1 copper chaperone PCu(A)C [Phaeovulum sp. NW3]